jgi:hypothetical protein
VLSAPLTVPVTVCWANAETWHKRIKRVENNRNLFLIMEILIVSETNRVDCLVLVLILTFKNNSIQETIIFSIYQVL